MNAICLLVDRLQAGHLGAYGNCWIETPAIDRLASQAFLFDHALIDSPKLELLYRSYWQGWHALGPPPPEDRPTLPVLLRDAEINTTLLTDDRTVAEHPLAAEFDELIELDPPPNRQPRPSGRGYGPAPEIDETHLARCFAQAISWLRSAQEPFLLWCHLGGLGTAWDAPLEFRRHYWEQGDPEVPTSAEVPEKLFPEDHDPDELLGISQAYAGQVSLLDTCIAALLEFLDGDAAAAETLLVLTSARGFPLGEHRRVGPCDEALYSELVHVPLLLRFPDGTGALGRSGALVEPADLWATLLDCFGVSDDWGKVEGGRRKAEGETGTGSPFPLPLSPLSGLMPIVHEEVTTLRDRLCIAGDGPERAIRTPAWYLRKGGRGKAEGGPPSPFPLSPSLSPQPELFAKPDDRWEINNVADRCAEVAECLEDALAQYEQTLQSGSVAELPPLSEILLSGLD